jgi:hypothetical protein
VTTVRVDSNVLRTVAAFLVLAVGLYRIVIDGLTPDGLALLTPALALLAVDTHKPSKPSSKTEET